MSKEYKYIEVYNRIKSDIIAGKYPSGSFLPTEDELIAIYDASKTTVRHACRMLADEKYIEIRQGKGTQVLSRSHRGSNMLYNSMNEIAMNFKKTRHPGMTSTIVFQAETIEATPEIAASMGTARGSILYKRRKIYLADGTIYSFADNYYRADLLPGIVGQEIPSAGSYDFFFERCGIEIDHAVDNIEVTEISEQDASMFGTPNRTALMIKRTVYCAGGVFEYSEITLNREMVKLEVAMDKESYTRNRIGTVHPKPRD